MKWLITTALCTFMGALTVYGQSCRVPVVPVEFSDEGFSDKSKNVDSKLSRAQKYFNDQFSPNQNFVFEQLPTVILSRERAWYGNNSTTLKDEHIDQAVREVCAALGNRDLSMYDADGDGTIDRLCLITAGGSEADGDGAAFIWPQQAFMSDRGGVCTAGGKTVDSFTVCPEKAGVGTFCHEFAHTLGLQDLYDTDGNGSGGSSKGVWGSLSLMDKGNANGGGNTPPNFSSIELDQLGLGRCIIASEGNITLHPIGESHEYMRMDGNTNGEYFLFECRANEGWDTYVGGSGLIVYHIDRSDNNSWYSDLYNTNLSARERWRLNQVNCRPDHPCAAVLEAVSNTAYPRFIFFPQENHKAIGSETDPALRFWNGTTADLAINEITKNADGSVSFDVITPIVLGVISVFQDAAIVSWTVDKSLLLKQIEVSWQSGGSVLTPRLDHCYYVIAGKLEPATQYRVSVKLVCYDGQTFSKSVEFTTKSAMKGGRPFIYLNTAEKLKDGSLQAGSSVPLHVYNATDAKAVEWFFDDKRITPDTDGYWHPEKSGTLKAKVWYSDGSTDIIVKKLRVK